MPASPFMRPYDPVRHASLTYLYGQDDGGHVGLYRMLNLAMLGDIDQAQRQAKSTIALAEEIDRPPVRLFSACLRNCTPIWSNMRKRW